MPDEPLSLRKQVVLRANGCCEYCSSQERFATHDFSVEHIVPHSKGGLDHLDNLALSCQGCNNFKYNKTEGRDPVSGEAVALFHPRKHQWTEHFSWNADFTQMIGLTLIGRATIYTLRLNRDGLQNLRHITFLAGQHPPKIQTENP